MLVVLGSIPSRDSLICDAQLHCTNGAQTVLKCNRGGGGKSNRESIGYTVFDFIVRNWLRSTASRIVHWATLVILLYVVAN